MSYTKIRFTAPKEAAYRLGDPMYVYQGKTHLGTLDPVVVRKDGTEIFIEPFTPAQALLDEPRDAGRLIFFEFCAFISENFPQIQAIAFAASRPVDALGRRPAEQAASRVKALESIGAEEIKVTPLTTGAHVVSGIWAYSERNLAALNAALEQHRAVFSTRPIGSGGIRRPGVFATLQRLVTKGLKA